MANNKITRNYSAAFMFQEFSLIFLLARVTITAIKTKNL